MAFSIKKQANLNLKKNITFKIPRTGASFLPSSLGGLALWLKADAGTTTEAEQFVNQIVLTGAIPIESSGTYTRSSGGNTNFIGPNGNYIEYVEGGIEENYYFVLYDTELEDYTFTILINPQGDDIVSIEPRSPSYSYESYSSTTSSTGNLIVTAWADQSENGLNANGNIVGGFNPLFVSNVKNGKPILRFGNNNNPTVLKTAQTTFGNSGNFTIIAVYNYNHSGNTWAELISKGDLATEAGSQFAISPRFIASEDPTQSSFGVMGYADETYGWNFLYQEPASTSWSIICGTQSITNNSQKYFVNGSLISESASVSAINQLNIAIGIGNGGSDSTPWLAEYGGFKGDLAEIIFYNRAVTTPERQQVEAYLNSKYQIY